MNLRIALLVCGITLAIVSPARAQDAALTQVFGSGVHAYFGGDFVRACDYLTTAIGEDTPDPRCYYFRGFCYLRLGRASAADADFRKGAAKESAETGRAYNVDKLLERVQGEDRIRLEQYRVNARIIAVKREEQIRRQLYEDNQREQRRVLEQLEQVPPGPAAKAPDKSAGGAFKAGAIDEAAKTGAAPEAQLPGIDAAEPRLTPDESAPAKPAKAGRGRTAKPAAKPAAGEANPFGGDAPASKPADDPFGGSKDADKPAAPAGDDPFGAKPAEKSEKPAAGKPAADDPFGAVPTKAAEKPSQPAAKAAGQPAAKPAESPAAAPAKPVAKPGSVFGALEKAMKKAVADEAAPGAAPAKPAEKPAATPATPVAKPAATPAAKPAAAPAKPAGKAPAKAADDDPFK